MTKQEATYLAKFLKLEKDQIAIYAELKTLENDHIAYYRKHDVLMLNIKAQQELLATCTARLGKTQAFRIADTATMQAYA